MTDTPTVSDVIHRLAELSRMLDAATAEIARLDAEIAEQQVRACRERIRTIRDQIEVGRSLNSAIKAEWGAGAVGQT